MMKDQDLFNSVAIVGGGNMAAAIIGGLHKHGTSLNDFLVIEPSPEKREALHQEFGVAVSDEILDATTKQVIVFAVKPQILKSVCDSIKPGIKDQLIISIAAGIRATSLSTWLDDHQKVIRVMPNTPAQVQAGISGMLALPSVSPNEREAADRLMQAVGLTTWVDDEANMDAITAISGSGPAYVFYCIEALQEAAIQLGLTEQQASQLATQTFLGASQLAASSETPVNTLREQVTSKGGTTEQGLQVLTDRKMKKIFYEAAKAAADRSVELGDQLAQP